ncbi:unnamed protein product, partial [Linum tenue]
YSLDLFGTFTINPCPSIPVVDDARKYDGIGLCRSFMWIIIIRSAYSNYISKSYKNYWNYYKVQLIQQLDHWGFLFFQEQSGLMKRGGPIGIGTQRKLGPYYWVQIL